MAEWKSKRVRRRKALTQRSQRTQRAQRRGGVWKSVRLKKFRFEKAGFRNTG
jgi:hypothetical protein